MDEEIQTIYRGTNIILEGQDFAHEDRVAIAIREVGAELLRAVATLAKVIYTRPTGIV